MSDTRKYTEAQKMSAKKWDAANLDRISIAAPKGTKDRWKAIAIAQEKSLNQFIVEAVDSQISQDSRKGPSEAAQGPLGGKEVFPYEPEKTPEVVSDGATAKED